MNINDANKANNTNTLQIEFKHPLAKTPKRANSTDAGLDLFVTCVEKLGLFKVQYWFGVAMTPPEGCFIDLRARSSVHKTFQILSNCCGTGDNGFTGEYRAVFYRIPFFSKLYKVGERAAQIIIQKYEHPTLLQVAKLKESERGSGGYGSSGK